LGVGFPDSAALHPGFKLVASVRADALAPVGARSRRSHQWNRRTL
jgi:hypothetical protein